MIEFTSVKIATLLLLGIGSLSSGGIGGFALLKRSDDRTIQAFALACLSTSLWAGSYLFRLLTANAELQQFLFKITYLGITLAPVTLLVFTLYYTGNDRLITERSVALLAVHPVLINTLLWTHGRHHLLYESISPGQPTLSTTPGLLFYPHIAYSYVLILCSLGLLAYYATTADALHRTQSGLLFAAAAFPLTVNVPFFLGIDFVEGVDLTPVALCGAMVLNGVAIYYGRLIELVPTAHAAVINVLDEGIIVINADQTITEINPEAAAFLERDRHELVGRGIATTLPREIKDLVQSGATTIVFEKQSPQGNEYYRIQTKAVEGAGVDGTIITITDITEQKRQQLRLERQNEKLDQAASVISHDLRSPLTIATGFLGKVDENHSGPDEHVEKVDEALTRINTIIDDVLNIARADENLNNLYEVDIGTVSKHAWDMTDVDGLKLQIEESDTVLADPSQLQQLFENLFRNVRDHTQADTIWVGIRDGTLYVEDNGRGIEEENQRTIFERGHTTADGGTGYGLSIVTDIVHAHGWEIDVTDGRQGGARFEIDTSEADIEDRTSLASE
jgi:signal transduction histidine kinase